MTSDPLSRRINILGVAVSAVNMDSALETAEAAIRRGDKGYICVTGVHGIMEAQADKSLLRILNNSLLTVPDGMPTVWLGRLYGHKAMSRVYGPDFMLHLCDRSQSLGYRHFIFGGNVGVAEELRMALLSRFPKLQITGTCTPPFRPMNASELESLRLQVSEGRPDVIWVGLSTPKQERFMQSALQGLDTKLMVGVGAAFDIHTGRIQDAPAWVKTCGLQWLHRLFQEPRRLSRRYLVNNPLFVMRIGAQLFADVIRGRPRAVSQ